jgi:hypothetical protein
MYVNVYIYHRKKDTVAGKGLYILLQDWHCCRRIYL